jgi:hypothetical protein
MGANVTIDVAVAIIRSRNGGYCIPYHSYGGRPNERNVLVGIADSRLAFLEHANNLRDWSVYSEMYCGQNVRW